MRFSRPLRAVATAAMAIFLAWHLLAVTIYAIPREARDPLSTALRVLLRPVVAPYVLLTSQWQQWNLFSPDPESAFTVFEVQVQGVGEWRTVRTIRGTEELQILRHLHTDADRLAPLWQRYLVDQCRDLALAPGTPVRMLARTVPIDPLGTPSLLTTHPGSVVPGPQMLCPPAV